MHQFENIASGKSVKIVPEDACGGRAAIKDFPFWTEQCNRVGAVLNEGPIVAFTLAQHIFDQVTVGNVGDQSQGSGNFASGIAQWAISCRIPPVSPGLRDVKLFIGLGDGFASQCSLDHLRNALFLQERKYVHWHLSQDLVNWHAGYLLHKGVPHGVPQLTVMLQQFMPLQGTLAGWGGVSQLCWIGPGGAPFDSGYHCDDSRHAKSKTGKVKGNLTCGNAQCVGMDVQEVSAIGKNGESACGTGVPTFAIGAVRNRGRQQQNKRVRNREQESCQSFQHKAGESSN